MAGIGLLTKLRTKRGDTKLEYEWGSSKVLQTLDLEKLTRAALRNHLDARDLDTQGTKRAMIKRLMADLEGERLQSIAYSEQLESEFHINKDIEERGSVYAVGTNYAGQLGQGDTEPRDVFTAVQKTRGLGVVRVTANADMAFGVTADHEVLVWGGDPLGTQIFNPTAMGAYATVSTQPFGRASRVRRERSIRRKISRIDFDATELQKFLLDASIPPVDVHAGGNGTGVTGIKVDLDDEWSKEMFMEPQFVLELQGEEVVDTTVGASHAAAVTSGGDVFVWGHNLCGQLGLTDFRSRATPEILSYFEQDPELRIDTISAGENHVAALSAQGRVYCWGHVDSGRLGLGVDERYGAKPAEKYFFPAPTLLSSLIDEPVCQIACGAAQQKRAKFPTSKAPFSAVFHSCGAAHTLALSDAGKVFAWGHGAGGRLGVGDFLSRIQPMQVEMLTNKCVLQIAAATWHSAAIVLNCVLNPPMQKSGWVYTWGSGYHGQLGHGKSQVVTKPSIVESLLGRNLSARSVCLGSHHSAMIAMDGEMYTWGSNLHGCLGHAIKEKVEHTSEPATPGRAHVKRGRGMDVARKLMEEEAIRLDMMRLEEEQERTIATQSQAKGDETVGSGDEADGASATGGAAGGP
ncbi:hypothetical protein JL721_12563 [Aureococcus anophagefferens]|nr:hypothetical protein JL721_12563 [Aureococcus anophagefferens]